MNTSVKNKPIRSFFKSFVNLQGWLSINKVREYSQMILSGAKTVLQSKKAYRTETFSAAVQRLHLTEQDIQKKQRQFFYFACFYLCIAFFVLGYAVYLFIHGHLVATVIAFSLLAVVLAYALREHFWYMQTKEQHLGCSWSDWGKFCYSSVAKIFKITSGEQK